MTGVFALRLVRPRSSTSFHNESLTCSQVSSSSRSASPCPLLPSCCQRYGRHSPPGQLCLPHGIMVPAPHASQRRSTACYGGGLMARRRASAPYGAPTASAGSFFNIGIRAGPVPPLPHLQKGPRVLRFRGAVLHADGGALPNSTRGPHDRLRTTPFLSQHRLCLRPTRRQMECSTPWHWAYSRGCA